ncbi:hypothetical protein BN136_2810 [Cronobacter universalis NCTC 9529]|nr:hypothetical protein BN136_2810 [Cronobacter universalis NCTC 9529]
MAQARVLHFLTQYAGAHRAGPHTGVAGDDDFTHVAQVVAQIRARRGRGAFGLRFHILHATGRSIDIVFFFHFAGFQQDSGHHEGDGHRGENRHQVCEVRAFRRHRQHRQDRARRRRRNQAAVQYGQAEDAGHTAQDNGEDQTRVHQHIREVDFVDTAQEVDDSRAACGLLRAAAAKEHVRQQNTHARTRVGFNQEEDRFAEFMRLLNAQRREDTVVDGVVEEQDFRRFNENRRQRQHVVNHHEVHARGQYFGEHFYRRANAEERQNREDHPDDARGEVVHQHFKAGFDFAVDRGVEFLDAEAAQRACDHCAQEHRDIRADDNAHGGNRAHHAAALAADQLTAGITDKQRQQVSDHRADQLRQRLVWPPSCGNK